MAETYVDAFVLAEKLERRKNKEVSFFLIDLRKESDFQLGRIDGAVNVPLQKIRFLAEKLWLKTDELIFYGYSADDRAAINALLILKNKGFSRLYFFSGGYVNWKSWEKTNRGI